MKNKIKNLGKLMPSVKELEYMRKQFVEAASLQGRIARFFQINHSKWKNTDPDIIYSDPVDVAYTLDANPEISTISRYGWFVEDRNNLPILAYLTFYDLEGNPVKIEEQCLMEITSQRDTLGTFDVKKFIVNSVVTDLELNMAVLNLQPYREKLKDNVQELGTKADPLGENKYFNRKEDWSRRIEG